MNNRKKKKINNVSYNFLNIDIIDYIDFLSNIIFNFNICCIFYFAYPKYFKCKQLIVKKPNRNIVKIEKTVDYFYRLYPIDCYFSRVY